MVYRISLSSYPLSYISLILYSYPSYPLYLSLLSLIPPIPYPSYPFTLVPLIVIPLTSLLSLNFSVLTKWFSKEWKIWNDAI